MRISLPLSILSVSFLLGCAGCAQPKGGDSAVALGGGSADGCDTLGSGVMATADGIEITGTEIENATAGQTFSLRQQIFEARRGWATNELAKRLIEREAKKVDMTLEEFLTKKVEGDSRPLTDADLQMFYKANAAQMKMPDGSVATFEQVKERIRQHLEEQTRNQKRSEYVQKLMADSNYKVTMDMPDPPMIAGVSPDDDPSKGPESASVTVVEFSDFQCPACRAADVRLPELLAKFEGKIRFVYRDFPLDRHPDALPAAVSGNCAKEQGK